MFDNAILGQVALAYSLFIDRDHNVGATRLTVLPLKASVRLDAARLLEVVRGVWPADGGRVSLNVASETLLRDLLDARPAPNVMVEVPSFMATDPDNSQAIRSLRASGTELLIKGRPLREVPRDVLPCFSYSIIDIADDRRRNDDAPVPPGVQRRIPYVQSGVRTRAEMEDSFRRGAAAVLGWPIDDAIEASPEGELAPHADAAVISDLLALVQAQAPVERLETTLRRDPSLGFRLLRYIHSPSFGLQFETASLRQAIEMLGYQRLAHWLSLLIAAPGVDTGVKPLAYSALRRGLVMEELAAAESDETLRSEMFLCGFFSLLDRMFQQPFAELLESVPVSERVHQALVDSTGPYQSYLEVARAVESGTRDDFCRAAEQSMLAEAEINRALLTALVYAARMR